MVGGGETVLSWYSNKWSLRDAPKPQRGRCRGACHHCTECFAVRLEASESCHGLLAFDPALMVAYLI